MWLCLNISESMYLRYISGKECVSDPVKPIIRDTVIRFVFFFEKKRIWNTLNFGELCSDLGVNGKQNTGFGGVCVPKGGNGEMEHELRRWSVFIKWKKKSLEHKTGKWACSEMMKRGIWNTIGVRSVF